MTKEISKILLIDDEEDFLFFCKQKFSSGKL